MTHPVCDYLQDKIRAFIASKNQSIRWLSKQSEVDYSIVYRLHQGEQKSLYFFPAYQLLKVMEPDNYLMILGEYFPEETRERLGSNKKLEDNSNLFKSVVSSVLSHSVFQHIALVPGASRSTVSYEFGQMGLKAVERLVNDGILVENSDGTFENKLDGTLLLSEDECKAYATINIGLLSLKKPGTHIYGISYGLNKSGLEESYQATADYIARLHEIGHEERNKGSNVFLASVASGPMIDSKN